MRLGVGVRGSTHMIQICPIVPYIYIYWDHIIWTIFWGSQYVVNIMGYILWEYIYYGGEILWVMGVPAPQGLRSWTSCNPLCVSFTWIKAYA